MDVELYNELKGYMIDAMNNLGLAYNACIDYYNNIYYGLKLNGEIFNKSDYETLTKNILDNYDKIRDVLIKEIDDKLM
jgi:hypothetical protein